MAFGRSNEDEEAGRAQLFKNNVGRNDRFILGLFDGDELVAIGGFYRHEPIKVQGIFNLYKGRSDAAFRSAPSEHCLTSAAVSVLYHHVQCVLGYFCVLRLRTPRRLYIWACVKTCCTAV